jgi:SAM-dependent methyltransferase
MTHDPAVAYRQLIDHPLVRAAWVSACGGRYWSDGDAPWSQCTIGDVQFAAHALELGASKRVADLGCGAGGFGRYAAREYGANVWGADLNPLAIAAAHERARAAKFAEKLSYAVSDACETGQPSASFDGVVSLDVWMFAPDKVRFANEAFRILRRGGSFAGTVWELRAPSASLFLPAFTNYEGTLRAAGFEVVAYEETQGWRELLANSLNALVAEEQRVRGDLDATICDRLFAWAKTRPQELDDSRRVRFHARKPS